MNPLPPIEPESAVLPVPADAAKLESLRRKARLWRRVYRLMMLAPVVCLTIGLLSTLLQGTGLVPLLPDWFFKVMILSTAMWLPATIPATCWRQAVVACQKQIDLQAIGLIVEGLPLSEGRSFAQGALAGMLPRLQANDSHLLTPRHHCILNRLVSRNEIYYDPLQGALKLAILKAYEQVGGAEDLPTVERLANGAGYARRNKDVREAAQACLPYLQARSEGQELRQNLLRASVAADNPATLLRPASASTETDPALLLRPSQSDAPQ